MTVEPPKPDHESDDARAARARVTGETESVALPATETQEHRPSLGAPGIPKRIGQYRIKRADRCMRVDQTINSERLNR